MQAHSGRSHQLARLTGNRDLPSIQKLQAHCAVRSSSLSTRMSTVHHPDSGTPSGRRRAVGSLPPTIVTWGSPAGNGTSSGTGPVRTGSSCQVGRQKDVSGLRVQAGQSLSEGQEPCWVGLKQEGADSGLSRTTGPELWFARWRTSSLWEAALPETLAAWVWGPVLLLNPGGPGLANTADVDVGQVASRLTFEACGDDGLPMNVNQVPFEVAETATGHRRVEPTW